ncbi:uncharacterized protein LOC142358225 [Convolutriloba macropyga]|uniref:uncharacterized protein LOC142358225 n=1 Tax=Convolutriloba macropyga TaxID=536237 RepID=UPI003F51BF9D
MVSTGAALSTSTTSLSSIGYIPSSTLSDSPTPGEELKLRKLFVGGLPWSSTTETLKKHFEQFGEIEEAAVIFDKETGKSKGFGFVTMKERKSADEACKDPNPYIDGRKANVNLAFLGQKPRTHSFSGSNPNLAALGLRPGAITPTSPGLMGHPAHIGMHGAALGMPGGNYLYPGHHGGISPMTAAAALMLQQNLAIAAIQQQQQQQQQLALAAAALQQQQAGAHHHHHHHPQPGHAASTALVPAGQLHGSTAVHGASAITQHSGGFQGSGSSAVGVAGAGGAGGGMTSQLQLLEIHNAIYSAGVHSSGASPAASVLHPGHPHHPTHPSVPSLSAAAAVTAPNPPSQQDHPAPAHLMSIHGAQAGVPLTPATAAQLALLSQLTNASNNAAGSQSP